MTYDPHVTMAMGIVRIAITKQCNDVTLHFVTALLSDVNSGPNYS